MNKVVLVGNLTRDPELSTISSGISVCKFGIAVNNQFGGEQKEADFFNIVAWRGLADNCAKYLVKGNKVAISGRISIRNVEDKDGNKRTYVDIVADDVEFLTPRSQQAAGYEPKDLGHANSSSKRVSEVTPVSDDDLPF
ncbi:MAG: single-stranded DNA-binding protein [Clostridiales bacterium]|jgi:single-strand DNA-binding protein|nr:single-stranded DNA-binding protein [Clostridiales bacterium]